MKDESSYRLNDYQITEHADGRLQWVAHFGLGMQRSGACHIYGDILLIGEWEKQEAGFLMLEFMENLRKLPGWNKTRYYCYTGSLKDVVTGKNVSEKAIRQLSAMPFPPCERPAISGNRDPETFQLRDYRITDRHDGNVHWETYGGAARLFGGQGVVESGILFIGHWKYQTAGSNRRQFLDKLRLLPKWDQTKLWCKNLSLMECTPFRKAVRLSGARKAIASIFSTRSMD